MNEKPLFYPKHLARQYVSSYRSVRSKSLSHSNSIANGSSPLRDVTNRRQTAHDRQVFAPKMTSSTVHLPKASGSVLSCFDERVIDKLRDIFDALDPGKTNCARFQDAVTLCANRQDDALLPEGVIASLSKVATNDGCLTFERFCAGIKIAWIRREANERKRREDDQSNKENKDSGNPPSLASMSDLATSRGGGSLVSDSRPIVTYQSPISPIPRNRKKGKPVMDAFVCSPLSRTNSLPTLMGALRAVDIVEQFDANTPAGCPQAPSPTPSEPWGGKPFEVDEAARQSILNGPPKPPRDPSRLSGIFMGGSTHSLPATSQGVTYPNISSHIHVNPTDNPIPFIWKSPPPEMCMPSHLAGQGFSIVVDDVNRHNINPKNDIVVRRNTGCFQGGTLRHSTRPMSAFDNSNNFLKQLLNDKKRGLQDGLAYIDTFRSNYLQKLAQVEHELRQSRVDFSPSQLENFQNHLSSEMRMINELNMQLASFSKPVNPGNGIDQNRGRSQKRGENNKLEDHSTDRQILRLQDQNRQLTAEVGKQGQVIYELEQEKRSLIRQLFQHSSAPTGSMDTIKMRASSSQHSKSQPHLPNKYNLSSGLS